MTIEEKFRIFSKLAKKAMELKEYGGHDIFVDYAPHVDWISIEIYDGPFEQWKKSKNFLIMLKYPDRARDTYQKIIHYLNGMTRNTEVSNG